MNNADIIIKEIQKGIINWYPFDHTSKALYVGENEAIKEQLTNSISNVISAKISELTEDFIQINQQAFDYIICISDIEITVDPVVYLSMMSKMIRSNGHLILGMNNRIGLRYFCGDRDIYTNHSFDSIDNYKNVYSDKMNDFQGRTYDKAEITNMLKISGWKKIKFFSVLSDLNNPYLIMADDYIPNEDLANRVFPTYNHPDSVFMEEETLYDTLLRNGMFHTMTNAFLIECTLSGEQSDINSVTSTMERGEEFAMITIIHSNGLVEKKAAYPEGVYRLEKIARNLNDISDHGLSVVKTSLENCVLKMPYIKAEVGQLYLKRLIYTDKNEFIKKMDRFRDLILCSSDIIKKDCGDGEGAILRYGYLDLVPLNSFYIDGEFVFYDQEFVEENYPANVLVWRMVSSFYAGNPQFNNILPIDFFLERYNLKTNLFKWQKMEGDFLSKLKNKKILRIYYEKNRRNNETVYSNRQRINYTYEEYHSLFVNIFSKIGTRKIVIFGSGAFTKRFIAMYGNEYNISAIIDNNAEKWGQTLSGIEIRSPDILTNISEDDYKIIICIKKYGAVARQLENLGFKDYSVFDTSRSYPKNISADLSGSISESQNKKYHIGYVAGVFDMFHIGHINLLRRAKEQCDYLIVGIVPDEGVFRQKNKYPIIPCDERVEVVQSCRYVDKAEALPLECRSIRDAYKMYRFDCMFTGTDYVDDPDWLADKEYLNKKGSDIVFFQYTEKTSSTKIREKLKS